MSNARLKRSHGRIGLGQPLSDLDFERCCPVSRTSDTGEDVAGHEAHGDPVRVVQDKSIVGREVELAGGRDRGSDGAPEL